MEVMQAIARMERKEADQLLDLARIVELRSRIMMIAFSLLDDESYTKEDAAKDLTMKLETLKIMESVHVELEGCIDGLLHINRDNVKRLVDSGLIKEKTPSATGIAEGA